MTQIDSYIIVVAPIPTEDGGGFVARVPDLTGCMGDGPTPEAAVTDARRAIIEWLDAYQTMGRQVPAPGGFITAQRQRQTDEIITLQGMIQSLQAELGQYASLAARIDAIEAEVKNLAATIADLEPWGQYPITAAVTQPARPQVC